MWRGWSVPLALGLALLGGCFTVDPDPALTRRDARLPFAAPDDADTVVLEVAALECPVNDLFINGPLWDDVDESATASCKTRLHANGLRVGTLGPTLPDRLLDLMTSERNRGNIRMHRLPAGESSALSVGPNWTRCEYELAGDDDTISVGLDKAQCQLELVPEAAKNGRTTLRFTPVVRHGETRLLPRPLREPSGVIRWDLQANPSIERYPCLGWELSAMPNEYVVVGAVPERIDALGRRMFLHTEGAAPVQRLLLVRVVQAATGAPKYAGDGKGPMPLALQAGRTAARGVGPGD
jgi:hypothetical protein